ncbi:ras-related protein Rab-27B [Octopus bimaculoides]|uniref:Uncharacterized protein n=1 Tax=Octopus bimaculoides TaxID=37653 RepID=A0A0L8FSB4_OCTBM|nr:ras-related protein Rab-27B [Octopus bimaculoides]XP_014787370.1 ras-related protein Rab-27B [Octopus bimaculoides]XP_014787371.1 ras-related protein Rab-27B [Octopus bimaculoides]|eukprot:XP_014787369.1 PREDICTED: ras-related protein Rab-27B-like [Octopus bimaculoides]
MSKYFLKWKQRIHNENDVSKEDVFQFIVIGDASVGKTTWINHFFSGYTSRSFAPTVGIDFRCKRMNYRIIQTLPNGQSKVYYRQASVQIWDTAGMERFRSLTLSYFRQARGFLLMVDLTNENTFVNAFDWLQKVDELAPVTGYDIIILANKCDLRRFKDVNDITLEEFAIKNSLVYLETSAVTGKNVTEAIRLLLRMAAYRRHCSLTDECQELKEKDIKLDFNKLTQNNSVCNCCTN